MTCWGAAPLDQRVDGVPRCFSGEPCGLRGLSQTEAQRPSKLAGMSYRPLACPGQSRRSAYNCHSSPSRGVHRRYRTSRAALADAATSRLPIWPKTAPGAARGRGGEDCVVDKVDIARIHSTDEDATADVIAAVLSDEAVVVEGVDGLPHFTE